MTETLVLQNEDSFKVHFKKEGDCCWQGGERIFVVSQKQGKQYAHLVDAKNVLKSNIATWSESRDECAGYAIAAFMRECFDRLFMRTGMTERQLFIIKDILPPFDGAFGNWHFQGPTLLQKTWRNSRGETDGWRFILDGEHIIWKYYALFGVNEDEYSERHCILETAKFRPMVKEFFASGKAELSTRSRGYIYLEKLNNKIRINFCDDNGAWCLADDMPLSGLNHLRAYYRL